MARRGGDIDADRWCSISSLSTWHVSFRYEQSVNRSQRKQHAFDDMIY